jgi:hypothetical protein
MTKEICVFLDVELEWVHSVRDLLQYTRARYFELRHAAGLSELGRVD